MGADAHRLDQYNTDEDKYLNADETGPHTPGPTAEVIVYLMEEKKALGWGGTQCIGTDAGSAGGFEIPFPAHNLLHKHNRYGLASLTNLDQLPAKGAILITAPAEDRQRHRLADPRARPDPHNLIGRPP